MMKNTNIEKSPVSLNVIFIALTVLGLVTLYLIRERSLLPTALFTYIGWVLVCVVSYIIANLLQSKNSGEFDFYKVTEPIERQEKRTKQNIEERVAIHIDEDGLDPMVVFNEEKSGVAFILKLTQLKPQHKLSMYLSQFDVNIEQQGKPIAGQTLLEVSFKEQLGYCRLTVNDGEPDTVDFAFPEHCELLYEQVSQAIHLLLEEDTETLVNKVNVMNFQALQKFYNYVLRLNAPENRSIEYLSYCQGTLKICNSSYVELYDCTLKSTLTSWVNQDGLIRTDNVDVNLEGNNILRLMDIELPYPICRLINIQIVKVDNPDVAVKLYLTLAELNDGQLTENLSGVTLSMQKSSIAIKRDELFADELVSVTEYFEQKSYPKF